MAQKSAGSELSTSLRLYKLIWDIGGWGWGVERWALTTYQRRLQLSLLNHCSDGDENDDDDDNGDDCEQYKTIKCMVTMRAFLSLVFLYSSSSISSC